MPAPSPKNQRTHDEALRRIEECRREKAKWLDLSRLGLTALPAELGQLSMLTVLYLQNNQLTALPAELGQLSMLTVLNLYNNQLTALPAELGQLSALTGLDLHGNQLTALPAELGQLSALEVLWLQSNRIVSLPPELRRLRRLKRLFLHDNAALNLSPAVLGADPHSGGVGYASAQAILDYYFSRQTEQTRPLNEVKLILVGRGGAGKTSTVQALRGEAFHEGEESTPGIALCDWEMPHCQGGAVTAHVWDFAGQVITHALHQFFFSVRSVYVVVLTGRENNERDDAEYWLRLIYAFGQDAQGEGPPVVVALNKWDTDGCRPRLDRGALRERYPFIREFVELDCKTARGVAKLQKVLGREVSRLKWVREPFPESWDRVRRELAQGGRKRAHLTYAAYRKLCAGLGVTDEGQQDSLSEILHNLGAALNYRTDPRLREATVLQPAWLTRNVYALMRKAEKQAGVLKQADVEAVLKAEQDREMRDYLVKIMERFEIAYAPKTAAAGVWLVPQALPDEQPPGAERFAGATEATRLRYTYQALPEGLVARAIVRLHEFIEEGKNGKKQQWASGTILARAGARALIRTEPQDRVVMFTVTGPKKARQQLAGLCQAEMRDLHREIPGLDPAEETQVQGEWLDTATLESDEQRGQPSGVSTKTGTRMIDPAAANDAYSEKPARSLEVWKPTVFISFSKANVTQRKALESQLKILMNEGLLARFWHDRMIDPGDPWDRTIQRELGEADVVIMLTSADALATDYITQHEIPKALELHAEGKTVVVPVILEVCRWDKMSLGPLNALPEKGKPVSKWGRSADAWKSVADGLAIVLQKLIDGRQRESPRKNPRRGSPVKVGAADQTQPRP